VSPLEERNQKTREKITGKLEISALKSVEEDGEQPLAKKKWSGRSGCSGPFLNSKIGDGGKTGHDGEECCHVKSLRPSKVKKKEKGKYHPSFKFRPITAKTGRRRGDHWGLNI